MIVLAPLTIFLMLAIGVRGRRATANITLFGPLLALVGVFFAGWALIGSTRPYDVNYSWLDVPLSISGAAQFQNFSVGVGIRITHASLLLIACALAVALLTFAWSRIGARGEPGPARYYGSLALLLFATIGVLVATDLLELYAFWGIAGVSTYLLLSHYWTDAVATRRGRLGMALPALTDLSLLAGIAILYSRYGQSNIDGLIPILHLTPGAGNKALVVATLLIFAGAAGRAAMFPFQAWLTAAGDAPPAALAAIQGLWPLMVVSLLYKTLPIFLSAGPWPLRIVAATAAVSAIAVPLSGLVGLDVRRAVTAAGIGLTGLAVLGFARPSVVALAIIAGAGSALARAALVLAAATLVVGMRSASLGEMGEGYRRMRLSAFGIVAGSAGLAFLTVEIAAQPLKWHWYVAYGASVVLVMLVAFRIYFISAHGTLARRRGFEPNRVREASFSLTLPPLLLGGLAFGLSIVAFSTRFLTFVDNKAHTHPSSVSSVAWLVVPLLGVGLAYLLFSQRRDLGARVTALAARCWDQATSAGQVVARMAYEPVLRLAGRTDEALADAGEERLGRSLSDAAIVTRYRLPILPLLVGFAVVLILLAGVFVPGVQR